MTDEARRRAAEEIREIAARAVHELEQSMTRFTASLALQMLGDGHGEAQLRAGLTERDITPRGGTPAEDALAVIDELRGMVRHLSELLDAPLPHVVLDVIEQLDEMLREHSAGALAGGGFRDALVGLRFVRNRLREALGPVNAALPARPLSTRARYTIPGLDGVWTIRGLETKDQGSDGRATLHMIKEA